MIWDKYVAVKLLPFAIIGIILSEFIATSIHLEVVFLLPFVPLLLLLARKKKRWAKTLFALCVFALVAGLGFARQSTRHVLKAGLEPYANSRASIVRVATEPEQKAKSTAYEVEIIKIEKDSVWYDSRHRGVLYVGLDSTAQNFHYGDILYIRGTWSEISGAKNPHSFDFGQFMARRGYYLSQFQYPSHIHRLDTGYVNPVMNRIHEFREYFENTLIKNGFTDDEFGVAKAVIMGDKTQVTPELLDKFSASGSMHVLAVSGLHVGIIYLIFFHLLRPLTKIRHGRLVRLGFLVLLLWCYALFTGLSASVVRASTMFTAVAFAQSVQRMTNIYNTIALSALVLLIWKPSLLFEVGFQLSYTAVIGIVSFQPIFESWYSPASKIGKWIYDLLSVSVAAQLATFPIALGVFNQFPNLFLLSNLWVIPMITVVLYFGVILLMLNAMIPLPHVFFKIWRWIIELMNWGVDRIEAIPYSATESIWISKTEVFAIYALIIGLFVLLKWGRANAFVWLVASFALLFGNRLSSESSDEVVFYSLPEGFAMDVSIGNSRSFLFTDSVDQSPGFDFHIRGNHLASEDHIIPISLDHRDSLARKGIYYRDHFLLCQDVVIQWWRGVELDVPVDFTIIDEDSGFINFDEAPVENWGHVLLAGHLSRGKGKWLQKQLTEKGIKVTNLADGYYSHAIN